ncbi:ribonuclease HII [Candidatus Pacearchaeota archaeon]|nr:ribonuclease HII [Candidatus Pacearchaeota archaeon]MBD3282797.1 ribonuclease HII [Candidatus Pacearchaeota archaeon]
MAKRILGIDEAGRGPVIGPLVISGVMIEEGNEALIDGVKDSKLLSHKKRIELDKKIKENSDFKIIIVNPAEVDEALEKDSMNLNWLEAHKQAEIINELNPDKAIIDCPSPNCKKYKDFLKNLLINKKIELVVEHKADFKYPTCSAASILSKVVREQEMHKIQQKYGNTGPGYSSNPITQEFVKNNWEKHPEIFRKTWSTFKNHEKKKNQKNLCDF